MSTSWTGIRQEIEHDGNLIDEEIAQTVAGKDVWPGLQVVVYLTVLPDPEPLRRAKGKMVEQGLDQIFRLAKQYGLMIAFGTDVVVNAGGCAGQNREFVERTRLFTPAELLAQAASLSCERLQVSGDRSPCPGWMAWRAAMSCASSRPGQSSVPAPSSGCWP